ncbi:MAG TPA: Calx-beta domain-containing protein, partial [Acidobacteriota bacterium]
SGTKEMIFTISLSMVPPSGVVISYEDDDGTAYAGFDFQPVSGQISIDAPNTTATISVPIYGDVDGEDDETFSIRLTSASYGNIADAEGIGTILNDDTACQFEDDFEDGTVDPLKWTIVKDSFTEQSGEFIGTPVKRKAQAIATGFSGCGSDCSLNTTMQSAGGVGSKVVALAWYVDKSNKVELTMNQDSGKWILKQRVNGKVVAKQKAISVIMPNTTYAVAILFDGNQFQVQIDGVTIITMNKATGSTPFGTFGYEVKNTTGRFASICVN